MLVGRANGDLKQGSVMLKTARKSATSSRTNGNGRGHVAFPSHVPIGILARLIGISERQVTILIAKNIFRKTPRGMDVIECIAAHTAYREGLAATKQGEGEFGRARTRLMIEKARMAALQRAKMESSVLDVSEVTERWSNTCSNVKTRFLASPAKLARQLAETSSPSECQRLLRDEVHENLSTLARGDFIPKVTQ
jgi:phage terminase Nu1 subunit (DNA packaging protein)